LQNENTSWELNKEAVNSTKGAPNIHLKRVNEIGVVLGARRSQNMKESLLSSKTNFVYQR